MPCPACGWRSGLDNSPPALALGRILDGRYRIGRVLGHGGFGITYLAWDDNLHLRLAIKEYFPRDSAGRGADGVSLAIYTGPAGEQFAYGLERFLEEARALAHFDQHPGIVTVKNFFRAHGTGYCVMDYVDGITLRHYLDQQPGGRISVADALKLLMPVMDALRAVHKEGLLHRDLAPDNIYLTQDGRIKLLDFGAARFAASEHSKSLSIILKPGYAPEEQYRTRGKQGPWTDVYGLAATCYRAITGQVPPESLDRLDNDDLVPPSRLGIAITPGQERVLLQALAVKAGQRFQSMAEMQQAWRAGAATPQPTGAPRGPVPPAAASPKAAPVDRPSAQGGAAMPEKDRAKPPVKASKTGRATGRFPVTFDDYDRFRRTSDNGWGRGRRPVITPVKGSKTGRAKIIGGLVLLVLVVSTWLGQREETRPPAQTAQLPAPSPSDLVTNGEERYRFLGEDQGIVEDSRTKLQWQRCSLGQTWTGATCAGVATEYTWDEAQRLAPAGWRLPTKDELASLVYCSSGEPAYWKPTDGRCEGAYGRPTIWSAAFPNTLETRMFWSSSPYAPYSGYAWLVFFGSGSVGYDYKHYQGFVRLVRGGQQEESYPPAQTTQPPAPSPSDSVTNGEGSTLSDREGVNAPSPPGAASSATGDASPHDHYRFLGKDQGIVEDSRTKLQWQRCSLGQTWTGVTCAGEATLHTWNEARRLAPAGWRLPTKDELASLVYCSSGEPAYWKPKEGGCEGAFGRPTIWPAAFPNTPAWLFWSSSPNANNSSFAWSVHFDSGYVSSYGKNYQRYVRLVRGGQ